MNGNDPGDLIPRPDPTLLTSTAVNAAKEDLRRELAALRELLEAQIAAVTSELHQTWTLHKADIDRAADAATALREVVFDKFHERDLRFSELDTARKEALETALRTARELVDTKAEAAQAAADKFQEAIVRQLDDATRSNSENRVRLSSQVAELEKRFAAEAGTTTGTTQSRESLRLNIGVMIAAAALAVSLVLGILLYIKK
jgi:hypothetical protein